MPTLMIYGANGYTGELIAREAVKRGLAVVLAGRSADKLEPLGRELDRTAKTFSVEDPSGMEAALKEVDVLLNCAGPFAHTAPSLISACLRTNTHYLDITGEIAVFEQLHAKDGEAKAQAITVLPGVGFDVVPTDCLAATLHAMLPTATHLELALRPSPRVSRGTAATAVEQMGRSGMVRQDGRLHEEVLGARQRTVDFGHGPERVYSIPWGDLATAWVQTKIPNIVTYAALPGGMQHLLGPARWLGKVLARPAVARFFQRQVRRSMSGPDEDQRKRWRSYVWGEVQDDAGRKASGVLQCPEMYGFTVQSALASAQRVLTGGVETGFQTPASAFGADFVLEIEGVQRTLHDVSGTQRFAAQA